jgi:hypothetical protein
MFYGKNRGIKKWDDDTSLLLGNKFRSVFKHYELWHSLKSAVGAKKN